MSTTSCDAFRHVGSPDASQLGALTKTKTVSTISIGSFNIGIKQDMLTSKNYETVLQKVEDVITACVHAAALDIMCLCECGGHRQGFHACRPPIRPEDMKLFHKSPQLSVSVNANYLAAWNFIAGTSQFGVAKVKDCCRSFCLSSEALQPEMVIHILQNSAGVILILANLHIRTLSGASVPLRYKQRLVREAVTFLNGVLPHDTATQPVVRVLVGDCSLTKDHAEEAVQALQPTAPHWRTVWQVHETSFGQSGDLMFVKGAHAFTFDLPVGKNHAFCGDPNNTHDAIGIMLRVAVEGTDASPGKRTRTGRNDAAASHPVGLDGDSCDPPAAKVRRLESPPRSDLVQQRGMAAKVAKDLRAFWNARGEEGAAVQSDLKNLRHVLFRKTKLPVDKDLWISAAGPPGEQQHVEAVVSETFVLQQLKNVIECRETWLKWQGLPLDTQMRDGLEREHFLKWAKAEFHAESFQLQKQAEDWEEFKHQPKAQYKWARRKNSRWNRELQRRLGSPALWLMVSFTGKFDVHLLRELSQESASETGEGVGKATQDLTRRAQKARDRLRYAEGLRRRRENGCRKFSAWQQSALKELDDGTLRSKANDATRQSGFGRIMNEDGSYQDIARHGGGIVKKLLDHVDPDAELGIDWGLGL